MLDELTKRVTGKTLMFHGLLKIEEEKLGRLHEKAGTGVCNCRHLAEVHEIMFQTIQAVKRGRCAVEGCPCRAYVRNPNYRVVGV
jgi:ferredoxin-thioredoxin reductase catalytic subunit